MSSVAKNIELSATSTESFDAAARAGVAKAAQSVRNIKGCWVKEQHLDVEGDKVVSYRVTLVITFVLD